MDEKKIKYTLRREISLFLSREKEVGEGYLRERLFDICNSFEVKEKIVLPAEVKNRVVSQIVADLSGYGPLDELMNDPGVTEIMINGPYNIYIEKDARKIHTSLRFDDDAHLRYMVEKMMKDTGRRLDSASPYVDFSLDDGSRVNIIIPPLSLGGTFVTIRRFSHTIKTVEDLAELGTLSSDMADFLVACVKAGANMLFSGATGVGKTTTLEVLSSYIPDNERIVAIEDTPEIKVNKDDVVRLVARFANIDGKGEVTIRDLFRNSLRMRPKRIILGEIRGKEALDYLQALNSGHRGSLAVIHASSPRDALGRLEVLALYAGLNLPAWAVRKQIASGLDIIVQQVQLNDGSRKITNISELQGVGGNGEIEVVDIFRFEIEGYDRDKGLRGEFLPCGNIPLIYDKIQKTGFKLRKDIFGG